MNPHEPHANVMYKRRGRVRQQQLQQQPYALTAIALPVGCLHTAASVEHRSM
jgi:hypothetical protein